MQQSLEPDESDKNVECSGRTVLECGCGEQMILLGLKEDWLSEQRTNFECKCGQILTLADRLDEDVVQESDRLCVKPSGHPEADLGALSLANNFAPVLRHPCGSRGRKERGRRV